MDKKLTLSLNEQVIANAKIFAKENQISLSKLIEAYLRSVTTNQTKTVKITPLVESLSGVVELPTKFDVRDEYADYLMEKYQ